MPRAKFDAQSAISLGYKPIEQGLDRELTGGLRLPEHLQLVAPGDSGIEIPWRESQRQNHCDGRHSREAANYAVDRFEASKGCPQKDVE
ncbi:hypothetical protein [Cohnella faecalis]|uniref:hypothetical protein n=1 Tax=Cohnella faecalis TaxID=2315694 RepID=UPI0011C22C89|nr:hypothetical protein [Cohnella faecalis]